MRNTLKVQKKHRKYWESLKSIPEKYPVSTKDILGKHFESKCKVRKEIAWNKKKITGFFLEKYQETGW